MRIAVCSDGHWLASKKGPKTMATQLGFERRHRVMVDGLLREHRSNGLDAVVYNGDLVHDDPTTIAYVKGMFDTLVDQGVYVHYGYGNHDFASNEQWRDLFGYSRSSHFVVGDYVVLCPNTSDEAGTYKCANPRWLNYWLNKYADKAGVVVCAHIYQHGTSYSGVNCPEIKASLQGAVNLILVVNSHHHQTNGVITQDGITIAFTGQFSFWGDSYYYRIVEATDAGRRTYLYDILSNEIVNETEL